MEDNSGHLEPLCYMSVMYAYRWMCVWQKIAKQKSRSLQIKNIITLHLNLH